jgi:hypothetical protein
MASGKERLLFPYEFCREMKTTMLLAGLMSCVMSAALGQTQLMINGGFESQNEGEWQISGLGAGIRDNPAVAYDGIGYLALGGASAGILQTVYQTITIPGNTVAAELTYYYNVFSSSQSSSDQFGAFIVNPVNSTVVATVNEVTGANSAGAEGPPYYQQVTFDLTAWTGQTIDLEFQASSSSATVFNVDDVSVWVETTADIPSNDYFTNRTALAGTSLNVQGNNAFATTEPGEPNILGYPPFNSLWWSWTAPTNGTLSLNTYATSFPNLLAVYTGFSLTNLIRVGAAVSANENGNPAQVTVLVNALTQYQIAVDGAGSLDYGSLELVLSFQADTNPPVVSFSSPAANATLTNSTVVVKGTAKDKFGLRIVEYHLENAHGTNAYQPATGTTNWSATITNLLPGLNTVRVFGIDSSSNVSPPVARSFTYAVVTPLVVTINGNGTLNPNNYNGQALRLNKSYAITAIPAKGSIFVNWTDGAGNILATTPKLSFPMTNGLELEANFIPNPFIPLAGTYAGLFADTNNFSPGSAGYFSATLTAQGSLTAQLQLAGSTYRFSGSFSPYGAYSNSVAGPGGKPLALQLQLDLDGNQGLAGSVGNSSGSAALAAYLAVPKTGLAQAGKKYTLVLVPPEPAGPSTEPMGYGFATLSVNTLGAIAFSGLLGDGTKVTASSVVVGSGQWPLCLSPSAYAGKGLAWGWLSFAANGAGQDVVGSLSWLKETGLPGALYPNGFGFTNGVQVLESPYSYTTSARVLNWTNGVIELAGGNFYQPDTLSPGLTNGVTLEANNKLVGTNKLSLTLTTASGLFQGTVPVPGTKTAISVSGVLLQGGNAGYGLFLGATNSGSVYLGPE